MSNAGKTINMTTMLIKAPRLISRHRLCISSILETAATPIVAAKKVSPLVSMLWLQFSMDRLFRRTAVIQFLAEPGGHQDSIIHGSTKLNGTDYNTRDKRQRRP